MKQQFNHLLCHSFTFSQCSLKNIIFDDNSKLQSIHQSSFSQSKIENISIPSNVTGIFYCAFSSCKNLKKLNIPENSRLKFIDSYAFGHSSIEDLHIPANLIELREGWCQNTPKLVDIKLSPENKEYKYLDNNRKMIIGKSNKNSKDFDILVFACRDITLAFIPSYIKRVCSYCFENCNNLTKVEFEKNTMLVSFGTGAFKSSQIELILITSHVKRIEKSCFENCRNLMNIEFNIEFEENSELFVIDKYAIKGTKISEKSIPSNVKIDLKEY